MKPGRSYSSGTTGRGRRSQDGRSCMERAVCSMCRCMKKKSIPEALRSLRGPRASRSRSSGPGCQPTPRNALRCFSESRCHLSREACHSWWNSRCCGDTSQPRSFSLSTMRSWARGSDALPQRSENPRSATAANAQALYASAQGSVARVRIVCPDLVEHRRAIVSRRHGTARLVRKRQRMLAELAPSKSPSTRKRGGSAARRRSGVSR